MRIDISNLQNHPQDVAVYEIGIKNRSEQGKGRSLNNQSNFDNNIRNKNITNEVDVIDEDNTNPY